MPLCLEENRRRAVMQAEDNYRIGCCVENDRKKTEPIKYEIKWRKYIVELSRKTRNLLRLRARQSNAIDAYFFFLDSMENIKIYEILELSGRG